MQVLIVILAIPALAACRAENPALAPLRARLAQPATLTSEELASVRAAVLDSIRDKHLQIPQGSATRDLNDEERTIVLGMLTESAGLFDEGLRQQDGTNVRVLNAPGVSEDREIEATRRLFIDIQTFQPRRFEFAHAFPAAGDYAYDLVVK
jgi:hypothetical protein